MPPRNGARAACPKRAGSPHPVPPARPAQRLSCRPRPQPQPQPQPQLHQHLHACTARSAQLCCFLGPARTGTGRPSSRTHAYPSISDAMACRTEPSDVPEQAHPSSYLSRARSRALITLHMHTHTSFDACMVWSHFAYGGTSTTSYQCVALLELSRAP